MDAIPDPHVPSDEHLLDVRTPAELAFSPDGSKVVFALHATVADLGSHPPSDLYLGDRDTDAPGQITSGAWSDRSPAWSPDGSRLAFLSDRITPGHQLPYAMVLGGEPVLRRTCTAHPRRSRGPARATACWCSRPIQAAMDWTGAPGRFGAPNPRPTPPPSDRARRAGVCSRSTSRPAMSRRSGRRA